MGGKAECAELQYPLRDELFDSMSWELAPRDRDSSSNEMTHDALTDGPPQCVNSNATMGLPLSATAEIEHWFGQCSTAGGSS
jgi:hypothetical protein